MKTNLKLIRSFLLLAVLIGSIIVSCEQNDEFNNGIENNNVTKGGFNYLEEGDIHLLQLRSTMTNRRKQLIEGVNNGINYNNLIWPFAQIKIENGIEEIRIPFKLEGDSKVAKMLYYSRN